MMAQLKNFQTGTGGDSFNGPVGSTTASTIAATTLTTSSTVTHNGGTANGVAYLNGSKVLTTGSALVFDGSNLGLGVTPSGSWGTQALMFGKTGSGSPTYPFIATVNTQDLTIGSNTYWNGTVWKAQFPSAVSAMKQTIGYNQIIWETAAAVTQNTTQTFTQAMTLDNSGNLLVGATSSSDGSLFKTASGFTALSAYRASSTAASGAFAVYSDVGGTQTVRAYVRNDGGLANYSANDLNLSDERLKKDIAPAGAYLAKICAIPVKTFRYNDQAETEDLTLGVIAQEVQQIAPELVSSAGFGTNEENQQDYLSIYQTDLQYALMKAIQELKAELDAYKATHP
jgi:hypothetical protein